MRIRVGIAGVALLAACNALNGSSDLIFASADAADGGNDQDATTGGADTGTNSPDASVDAGPDAFFGTGRSGPLALFSGTTVINTYEAVSIPAKAGDSAITVADATSFEAGQLLLLWQTTGLAKATSGDPSAVSLPSGSVGHYELARVTGTAPPRVLLEAPLAFDYPSDVSQIVRVPEYTDVTIPAASGIVAAAWDGKKGGIVAFLASGAVANDGEISVDGMGFRGGVGIQGPGGSACTSFDGTPLTGYAAKGEGVAPASYGTDIGGRGNVANGAGGGDCHNGGGAGGGHGGSGGGGGQGENNLTGGLGGLGGATLVYPPFQALLMGGGGAAGDDNNGPPLPSGGAGGGAVFVRARLIHGVGLISANGAPGGAAPVNDGAGGGGAGGGIIVDAMTGNVLRVRAEGGPGGSSPSGASGGGGGGGVIASSTGLKAKTSTVGGDAGTGIGTKASTGGAPGREPAP